MPVARGSYLFGCGAGSGTGDAEIAPVEAGPSESGSGVPESTAKTTLGSALGLAVSDAACSDSQRAQQIVRRTHSGDGAWGRLEVSEKAMLSQGTKASSRCTRMRGLVPTWASSRREAVRARWASALVPFLRRSRVLRAVGEMHEPVSCAGSGTDLRAGR